MTSAICLDFLNFSISVHFILATQPDDTQFQGLEEACGRRCPRTNS